MSLLKSKYYDHPDGEDAVGKVFVANKYALAAGLGWSTLDVLMVSHPKGYLPTIARYIHFTGPFMGMATAFTLGTFLSTRLRQEDDKLNYVIGACAAGGVFGAWRRNPVHGLTMCLFFSIAASLKKMSIRDGWEFFPSNTLEKHGYGSLKSRNYDFTLMADREKGWSTK